jgi:septal ring factor EnvC (AmiA/AmiB activator)
MIEPKDLERTERELEKTNSEIEKIDAERESLELKITQLEHQVSTLTNRAKEEARRRRTHRLIVRGAMLESLIPDAEIRKDDEIKHLLISMIGAIPDKLREEIFRKKMIDDE